ncbi:MAG TPA: c-type cytochrome [Sphingomicrobium sp.]
MRINKAKMVVASALALVGATAIQAQGSGKTVWDGVYTEAQNQRGAQAYAQNCSSCHGVTLGGTGEAPGLTGGEFLGNWNGLSVGELYDRIRTTMPFDKPGSLSREAYADVTAHVLKANGFPAGQTELDKRSEVLATINIPAQRPANAAAAAAPAGAAPSNNP